MSEPFMIHLTTTFEASKANGIKAILDGQTFYNVRIVICPTPGGLEIYAETFHVEGHTEDEFKEMLLMVLTDELIRRAL